MVGDTFLSRHCSQKSG